MVIAGPNYECFNLDMGTNKRLNEAEVWKKSEISCLTKSNGFNLSPLTELFVFFR